MLSLRKLKVETQEENSEADRTNQYRTNNDDFESLPKQELKFPTSYFPTYRLFGGEDEEDDDLKPVEQRENRRKLRKILRLIRIYLLFGFWIGFTFLLIIKSESKEKPPQYIFLPGDTPKYLLLSQYPRSDMLGLTVNGPFKKRISEKLDISKNVKDRNELEMNVVETLLGPNDEIVKETIMSQSTIVLVHPANFSYQKWEREYRFELKNLEKGENMRLQLKFRHKCKEAMALKVKVDLVAVPISKGVLFSCLLLFIFYMLLFLDVTQRVMSVMMICCLAIALLGLEEKRPSLKELSLWIDYEALIFLFCIQIIVYMLKQTGVLDYLVVLGFKFAHGHIWPMLNVLIFTLVSSALFVNNVTMVVLLTPIVLHLCELINVSPIPAMCMVLIFTQLGSIWSPLSGIFSKKFLQLEFFNLNGVTIFQFIAHMLPGAILAILTAYMHLRILYHNSSKMELNTTPEEEQLRRQIKSYGRVAKGINAYTKEEDIVRESIANRARVLRNRLKRLGKMPHKVHNYEETLKELQQKYTIKNKVLLIKCLIVSAFYVIAHIIICFSDILKLDLTWISLLALILLLILIDLKDLEGLFHHIDWSTLVFFAVLCVFIRALIELGFARTLSEFIWSLIENTPKKYQLIVALLTLVCTSALSSAFLGESGTYEVTRLIIRNLIGDWQLPVLPVVCSMISGVIIGGFGTLVGSLSAIVCAGLAEKNGHTFYFFTYFKVGFIVMMECCIVMFINFCFLHVLLEWHDTDIIYKNH